MARMCIVFEEAGLEMTVQLNDSATAAAIWSALPLESAAQTWGAEVYFSVPVDCGPEDPHATVISGAVGYWPPGKAVCLFFGQQPVSPVNLKKRARSPSSSQHTGTTPNIDTLVFAYVCGQNSLHTGVRVGDAEGRAALQAR